MKLKFADLVETSAVQTLMDNFWQASGIPTGIIDVEGTVLVATGWQDICTRFHRQHPQTSKRCRESDRYLQHFLQAGHSLPACGYVEYPCKNGMIDIGVPIIIADQHLADLYMGQFFYEPPDEEFFRKQAQDCGFDEKDYLQALHTVPILSQEKIAAIMQFNLGLVELLSKMALEKLHQLDVKHQLKEKEEKFRFLFQYSNDAIYIWRPDGRILEANEAASEQYNMSRSELLRTNLAQLLAPDCTGNIPNRVQEIMDNGRMVFETRLRRPDGSEFPAEVSARTFVYQGQPAILSSCRDISARQKALEELAYRETFESLIASISKRFVGSPLSLIDRNLDISLRELAEFSRADRAFLFHYANETAHCSHEWCAPGITPMFDESQDLRKERFPWITKQFETKPLIAISRVDDLPEEAFHEKTHWMERGIRSLLLVPIIIAGQLNGSLAFETVNRYKTWDEKDFTLLHTAAGIFSGVIERQETAAKLQQSEERLSLALQVSNEGVWDWNLSSGKIHFSPRYFTMLGYQPDEFPDCFETWSSLLHPGDRENALAFVEDYINHFSGQNYQQEFRMCGKGGAIFHILARGDVVAFDNQGRPNRIVGTHMDITDRKRSETALKNALQESEESRDKIDSILKSVADGLIVTNAEQRIVLMNQMAADSVGISSKTAHMHPIAEVVREQKLVSQIRAVWEEQDCSEPLELVLSPLERSQTILQARTSLVYSRDGQKLGTITLLRDMTREWELDRMKNEFISTAAHELRTPLTTIMGFSEILLQPDEFGLNDPQQQKELLATIHHKAMRLEAIISDLLDLSRVQSGQLINLQKDDFDFHLLCRRLVNEYRQKPTGHHFTLGLPTTPLQLRADQDKLIQVLENLVSNAIKFSPQGSTIRIVVQQDEDMLHVVVQDEGIGMSPSQVSKVFDKFYRVDASDTAVEGLGLGMAIVKNIIESHGGLIWVDSSMHLGTSVHFTLPLLEQPIRQAVR